MKTKNYSDIVLNALPDREMEIVGKITAERMSVLREKAIAKLKETVEVDGFRKGNVPDSIIVQKVGDMRILEEAAEIALSEEYPNILEEHDIDAIGRPEVTITKLAPGNPLEFKAKTALMPEVKLADYKKIAKVEHGKKLEVPEIVEKEVDAVVLTVRKNIAHQMMHSAEGRSAEEAEHHNHGEIKDEDLPAVDENFLKMLGDFKDESDFRAKIKENLEKEKEVKEKDKKRTSILEAIMKDSTIELPKIIIEGELEKMSAQFKDDLAKSGVPYDEYLKHIKKTEEDMRKDWNETAVKRAKSQIILNTIAKEEKIAPEEAEIKKEMENILSHYKDAERFRVRMYVETFMTNDLVFQFLENLK